MEYKVLTNGIKMPMEGFGVFQVRDKEECKESVLNAIRAGYRLIDTAASYTNEDAVGEAVREAIAEGICTREELFITSKMWVQDMQNYEMAKKAIDHSIETLGVEYLDLYLLHQAMKDYFSAWRAMEDAYKEGKLRAIGVSNFYPHVLTNFCETVAIRPMVNQIEMHPYFTQEPALKVMEEYQVVPEAWAPLGGGRHNPFDNEMVKEIAAAHGKTVGQVVLRWNVQRGVVVIPKSVHKARIEENFQIWDFTLTEEEMQKIADVIAEEGRAKYNAFSKEEDRDIFAFPSAPRLVVTSTTPLAPRTPNTAVAEASFKTLTLSISLGSIWKKERSTPSTNINGCEPASVNEPTPRT